MAKRTNETRAGQARKQGLLFQGKPGQHISGVPATDLLPTQIGRLTLNQIDACLDSGLYIINEATPQEEVTE